MSPWKATLIVALCTVFSPSLAAQELASAVRLSVDNDYFNFWLPAFERPDHDYTHGTHLSLDLASSPTFARALLCRAGWACGTTVRIGQEIYTPVREATVPIPGERPHAGWLYARVGFRGATPRIMRTIDVTLGITGPASLADVIQTRFHKRFAFRQSVGWENQLPNELSFGVEATQSWRAAPSAAIGRFVDVVPRVSATAGTLRVAASAGVRARLGTGLSHPWLASELHDFSVYGFAGAGGELVARDLFLDGTVFHQSIRVPHTPALVELEWGAGLELRRLLLEYRAVTRSREYAGGPASHTYGSLAASWRLR